MPDAFEHGYADLGDVRLHYVTAGKGPAVVRGGVAENCGHWIPEERPDWVVERLLAFFAEAAG